MGSQRRTSPRGGRVTWFLIGTGILATGLLAGRAYGISFWGEKAEETPTAQAAPAPAGQSTSTGIAGLPDFAKLAEQLSPCVVNISTTSVTEPRQGRGAPGEPGGQGGPFGRQDPFHDFMEPFERFFGPMPRRPFRQKSLGSGFIINHDGLILTNNHVVENADDIVVRLSDDKEFKAKVIGRDTKTDIAVIKIDGAADLTTAQAHLDQWLAADLALTVVDLATPSGWRTA